MKVIKFVALATCILFVACSKKDDTLPVTPPLTKKDFSPLTAIMQSNLSAFNGNAGLLLMDKDGKVLYKQYFGSYTDNTYIPIASGSKLPSMATVMALIEDNSLDINLDDKVTKFFPTEFSANDRKDITLRQLMSHTSGLTGSSSWIGGGAYSTITVKQATQGIGQGGTVGGNPVAAASMTNIPIGTKFAYGGVSMHVAGGIAEKVAGKSWDLIFKERIADKCQMPNTNYIGLGATTNYRIAGGAGTRMMEYANFLLMLTNEGKFNGVQVLTKTSVDEMLKDQTNGATIVDSPYDGDALRSTFRYGLGCWLEEYTNGVPTAFGDQGAFGFSPWIDKKRGVIGILFIQSSYSTINTQPTPQTAPYTLLRNKVNEILDAQ